MGDLVDIDQLIDKDEHPRIARLPQKCSKQLQILIPVIIRDDDIHAERMTCLRLGCILPAEPSCHLCTQRIVTVAVGMIVERQKTRKVETVDKVIQPVNHRSNTPLYCRREVRTVRRRFLRRLLLHATDPAIEDEGECAPLGRRLGCHIADQLTIGCEPLPTRPLKPALRREICIHHDEILRHHIAAQGLKEETLAAPIAPHNKTKGCAALCNHIHIRQKRLDLTPTPHRDIGKPDTRHNAPLERIDERLRDTARNLPLFIRCHDCTSLPIPPDSPPQRQAARPLSPYRKNPHTASR